MKLTLEMTMKTHIPTGFGLGAALLLVILASPAHAASRTVKNLGGYVAGFYLNRTVDKSYGCGYDDHDRTDSLPLFQHHTVDLDIAQRRWWEPNSILNRCNGAEMGISILEGTHTTRMYHLPYENRYPTGFKLVKKADYRKGKEGVWLVEGGLPSEANRPLHGDLTLVLHGTVSWATVDYYTITRDFRSMDLSEANLTGANLSETDFRNANLIAANLSNANLRGADLRGADLWKAQLSGAYLLDVKTDHTTHCPNDQRGPCW